MNEKRDRRVVNVQARARKERREEMREPQRGVVAIMLALSVCVCVCLCLCFIDEWFDSALFITAHQCDWVVVHMTIATLRSEGQKYLRT